MTLEHHTIGPWKVGSQDKIIGYYKIVARTGVTKVSVIARTDAHEVGYGISSDEQRANAHLLAAAPELYAALKAAVAGDADWRDKAAAAVKKAKADQ